MNESSIDPTAKPEERKPKNILKKIILFSIPMSLIVLLSGLRFLPVSEKLALVGFFASILSSLVFVISVFLFLVAVVAAFTLFKTKKFIIPIGIFVLNLILVTLSFGFVNDFLQGKALDRAVINAQPIIIALNEFKNANNRRMYPWQTIPKKLEKRN